MFAADPSAIRDDWRLPLVAQLLPTLATLYRLGTDEPVGGGGIGQISSKNESTVRAVIGRLLDAVVAT